MSDETRQKILDAALNAFSEKPFDAVSLRSLVAAAGVNQAAINYHFRSKLGVYEILLDDIAGHLTEMRGSNLKSAGHSSALNEVLTAHVQPFLQLAETDRRQALFLARFLQEPAEFVRERLPRTFGESDRKFAKALQKAVPDLSPADAAYCLSIFTLASLSILSNPIADEVLGKAVNDRDMATNLQRLIASQSATIRSFVAPADTSQPDLFS